MEEEFVDIVLQLKKGQVVVENSKDPEFPDGKYPSLCRLVKRVGSKLWLDIILFHENPNLCCDKCGEDIPPFHSFGYLCKLEPESDNEIAVTICLSCLSETSNSEMSRFIMTWGEKSWAGSGKQYKYRKRSSKTPPSKKWKKISSDLAREVEEYLKNKKEKGK